MKISKKAKVSKIFTEKRVLRFYRYYLKYSIFPSGNQDHEPDILRII